MTLHKWEQVNPVGGTYRMKVPGGWLYRDRTPDGVAMCFVPDESEAKPRREIVDLTNAIRLMAGRI